MRRDTYLAPRHHCKQPCHRGSRYRSMRGEHWVGVGVAGRCVGIPQSCEPPMIRIESRVRGETRWPRHMGANTKQRGPSPRNITRRRHTPTGVAVGGLVSRTVGAESPKIRLMRCSCPRDRLDVPCGSARPRRCSCSRCVRRSAWRRPSLAGCRCRPCTARTAPRTAG